MSDYSTYFEELYEAAIKNLAPIEQDPLPGENEKTEIPVPDEIKPGELVNLTQEIIDTHFYDFEKLHDFVGIFQGDGQSYIVPGGHINTWSFKDVNAMTWLIPKWSAMDEPQGNFSGFSKEIPGEWTYIICYSGNEKTENGIKHNIKIFRKRL